MNELRDAALAAVLDRLDILRQRDSIVRSALTLGISKAEIHRRSGLARDTIDRIARTSPGQANPSATTHP